jgi:hypothetical protein
MAFVIHSKRNPNVKIFSISLAVILFLGVIYHRACAMAHFHLNVMLRDKEAHQGALPGQLSHRLDGGQSIWLLACPKKLSP